MLFRSVAATGEWRDLSVSRKITAQLLKLHETAKPEHIASGLTWYGAANKEAWRLSIAYDLAMKQAAGVIAVLSPGCEWSKNLEYAYMLIGAWYLGRRGAELPMVGVYGKKNLDKAVRILSGEDPEVVIPDKSRKVKAFYRCILSPETSQDVVIDRHAKCAALSARSRRSGYASQDTAVTDKEYLELAAVYGKIAKRLGYLPSEFQAIIWVTWKGQAEKNG